MARVPALRNLRTTRPGSGSDSVLPNSPKPFAQSRSLTWLLRSSSRQGFVRRRGSARSWQARGRTRATQRASDARRTAGRSIAPRVTPAKSLEGRCVSMPRTRSQLGPPAVRSRDGWLAICEQRQRERSGERAEATFGPFTATTTPAGKLSIEAPALRLSILDVSQHPFEYLNNIAQRHPEFLDALRWAGWI